MTRRKALVALLLPCALVGAERVAEREGDPLTEVESLQAELHDVAAALRHGDTRRVAEFFAEPSSFSPLPSSPLPLRPKVKWIRQHGWRPAPREPRDTPRDEVAGSWGSWLRHFAEVEDARFEVQQATFDQGFAKASATVVFSLIGRDHDRRREWARGTAALQALRKQADRWTITAWRTEGVESLVADVDLFSDVSSSAGIAAKASLSAGYGDHHGAAAGDLDGDGLIDLVVTGQERNYVFLNDGHGGFREVAAAVGLSPTPVAAAPLLVDIDNDGDLDVFFSAVGQQMLFENRLVPEGKLRFRDISQEAGVGVYTAGFSAVAGDVNNDGLPDIYVCGYNRFDRTIPNSLYAASNGTPNLLFLNQGGRRFREVAREAGVDDPRWSYDAELVDFDEDGALDIYVVNDFAENALYRNLLKETGQLRFRNVAREVGATRLGFGMGVSFGDYNNDGHLDIHATYLSSTATDRMLRLFPPAEGLPPELLRMVAGNGLYANLGNGTFREVTDSVGPFPAGWAWGGGFIDFDNDGWQDLHSVNGMMTGTDRTDIVPFFVHGMLTMKPQAGPAASSAGADPTPEPRPAPMLAKWGPSVQGKAHSFAGFERDTLYLNLKGRYLDISGVSGLDSVTDGRAAVYADFDNDGDLDVFLTTLDGHRLFRNNVGQDAPHIRIALQGTTCGRDAFGAVVRVKSAVGIQTKVKSGGEGHISQHDPRLLFGLGRESSAEWVEVTWPSGLKQRFGPVRAGQSLRVTEGSDPVEVVEPRTSPLEATAAATAGPYPPRPGGDRGTIR